MKAYDLTGQRFGRLLPLYKCNYKKGNKYPWHCKCDCGNECDIPTQDLITGKIKSCGCLRKENAIKLGVRTGPINGKKRAKDLTNKKFGRLIALKPTDKRRDSNIIWLCKCNCGSLLNVPANDLLSGNTTSCGCIKSKGQEKIAQLLTENNISFVNEKSFENFYYDDSNGKPRFDFYVNNFYLIEFDGIQHYQNVEFFHTSLEVQQHHDSIKNNWCLQNHIPLIRIPYYHLSNLKIDDLILETSEFII